MKIENDGAYVAKEKRMASRGAAYHARVAGVICGFIIRQRALLAWQRQAGTFRPNRRTLCPDADAMIWAVSGLDQETVVR
jgi:hypothetical protein